MAHEIEATDNLAYVGDTPWHSLGDAIPAGTSIDDAMAIACKRQDGTAGMWDVQKRPIQITGGKAISDHYAITRDDTGEALGVVGSKYTPLTNKAAADWYRPILDTGLVDVEVAGTLKGGRIVWILGKIKDGEASIGRGDSVRRYTLLAHGHDGSLTITPGLTDVRVVCRNTLSAALGSRSELISGVRHTKNHASKLDNARDAIVKSIKGFGKTVELYRELAAAPVKSPKHVTAFAAAVFGAVEAKAQANQEVTPRLQALVDRFEHGTGQNLAPAKHTWWGMFNALTELITHGAEVPTKDGKRTKHVGGKSAESRAASLFGDTSNARALRRGLDASLQFARAGTEAEYDSVVEVLRAREDRMVQERVRSYG